MRHHELATDMHSAKREWPRDIASLLVKEAQWHDMREICDNFGGTEIIGVERLPIPPAFRVAALCRDRSCLCTDGCLVGALSDR